MGAGELGPLDIMEGFVMEDIQKERAVKENSLTGELGSCSLAFLQAPPKSQMLMTHEFSSISKEQQVPKQGDVDYVALAGAYL